MGKSRAKSLLTMQKCELQELRMGRSYGYAMDINGRRQRGPMHVLATGACPLLPSSFPCLARSYVSSLYWAVTTMVRPVACSSRHDA